MHDWSHPKGLRTAWLLVTLALLCAQRGHAGEIAAPPPTSTPTPQALACTVPAPEPQATEALRGGGMLAFIDPQTGRLTSTPSDQQREELRQALGGLINESTEGLVAVRHADGRLSMDLEGRFMNFSMIALGPSGGPSFSCTHHVEDAVKFLTTPAIPTLDGLETE